MSRSVVDHRVGPAHRASAVPGLHGMYRSSRPRAGPRPGVSVDGAWSAGHCESCSPDPVSPPPLHTATALAQIAPSHPCANAKRPAAACPVADPSGDTGAGGRNGGFATGSCMPDRTTWAPAAATAASRWPRSLPATCANAKRPAAACPAAHPGRRRPQRRLRVGPRSPRVSCECAPHGRIVSTGAPGPWARPPCDADESSTQWRLPLGAPPPLGARGPRRRMPYPLAGTRTVSRLVNA